MHSNEPRLLSRRSVLAAGATLALPSACATPLPSLRDMNLDAITDEQALVLGRIQVTGLDTDLTGDAFALTSASPDYQLLPSDGEVAWIVRRPRPEDVRLLALTFSRGGGYARDAVLAPDSVRTAINYFGTVRITIERGFNDVRGSGRARRSKLTIEDQQATAMPAFVAQNPRLAGRMYYDVPRREMLQAPPLRG